MSFTAFNIDISKIPLPEKFTYPFYYTPHPLCELAAQQLQEQLLKQKWEHNFDAPNLSDRPAIGKMFGVLVVKNDENQIGFLSAVSGKLQGKIPSSVLVPSLNKLDFLFEKKEIEQLNEQIQQLENDSLYQNLQEDLIKQQALAQTEIDQFRKFMIKKKKERKLRRLEGDNEQELVQESLHYKYQLKKLKEKWQNNLTSLQAQLNSYQEKIQKLQEQRQEILHSVQKKHFEQYQFLNFNGQIKNLYELFTGLSIPPGSGDCTAPQLLQYAYQHHYTPLCMAEFWWGAPHKSAIRKHKQFYPACSGRCRPILDHMLQGLSVDTNPLLENEAQDKKIEILYEDQHLKIINKPHGLLSVPGKEINDSVASRFPGELIVHRLDQETSGIMILAKDTRTHKNIQRQFIQRQIKKRYLALLEGKVSPGEGEINLPLRGDPYRRPYQLVCFDHGKKAITHYQVLKEKDQRTLIHFFPHTGRTHQLRVHAAFTQGLNAPIVGDTLYGKKNDRLYLHADLLEFIHPVTQEKITISCPISFLA